MDFSHDFCLHLTCVHIALLGLKYGYEHMENYLTPSAPVEAAAAGIGGWEQSYTPVTQHSLQKKYSCLL